MYDLIIIGGGPAAMSAGIYAARKKLKILLVCKQLGGQVNEAGQVENYLGFESILGPQLVQKFVSHLRKFDVEIKERTEVQKIKRITDSGFEISAGHNGKYQALAIIITSGRGSKKLSVPGEEKFIGKGVSFCAICDAPLFKDREVAVIGAGNAAAESAMEMAKYASKVYFLSLYSRLTADELVREKIKAIPNITVLFSVQVKEIQGDKFVTGLIYQDKISQQEKKLIVQGVHVEIGSVPSSNFIKDMVELNDKGEIKIDSQNKASEEGIFAAGDVTDVLHKQIVVAAGEGAKAALNAYEYIKRTNGKQ